MSVDRWLRSRAALVVAFVWGLAEATLFFIVPDVLITFIGCRALRPAMKTTVAALIGALLGGAITYHFGTPEVIERVPGIHHELVASVKNQLTEHGVAALMFGPLLGIPYKIYAIEWAARGGSLVLFLLVSIPARWLRFALSALLARGIANLLALWTHRRAAAEWTIVAIFWVAFYAWYFAHFGW